MKRTVSIIFVFALAATVLGQPLSERKIDRLAERVMQEFNVPGIAVAVVKDTV